MSFSSLFSSSFSSSQFLTPIVGFPSINETYDRITAPKDLQRAPSICNLSSRVNDLDALSLAQGTILQHLPSQAIVLNRVDNYNVTLLTCMGRLADSFMLPSPTWSLWNTTQILRKCFSFSTPHHACLQCQIGASKPERYVRGVKTGQRKLDRPPLARGDSHTAAILGSP